MLKVLQFIARLLSHIVPIIGVNKKVFYAIVSTKLVTDFRRSKNVGSINPKAKNTFGRQLFIFFSLSFIFGIAIDNFDQPEMVFTMMFALIMVLTCTALLTEFTTVLFNEHDNSILLARPVSSKTLLVSRLGHIVLYLFAIAISLCFVPALFISIKYNAVTGFLFLLSGLLSAWISLLITIFCYALLSRIISGERFKDVLTYLQIGVAIFFMLTYQLFLGSGNSVSMLSDGLSDAWWVYLFVPVWLAKSTAVTLTPFGLWNGISIALVAVTCIIGAKIVINLFAKEFDNILSSVSSSTSKDEVFEKERDQKWSVPRLLCISEYELAGWKLSSTSIKRDRQFKQTVYPILSYGFIFIIVAVLKNYEGGYSQTLENLANSENFFLFLLPTLFLAMPLSYLRYTNNGDAAWVYNLVPEDKKYHLLSGALKAAILRFCIPPYALVTLFVSLLYGPSIILPYILGCSFVILIALVCELMDRELPLSKGYDQISKGETSLRMFLLMIINGLAFAVLHFIKDMHYGISLGLLILVVSCIFLAMRATRRNNTTINYKTEV